MDYPSEPKGFLGKPKGFVPNTIPNIFYDYKGKSGKSTEKGNLEKPNNQ